MTHPPTTAQALDTVRDALWILQGQLAYSREDLDDILAAEITRQAFRRIPQSERDPFGWAHALESAACALVARTLADCGGSYAAAFLQLEDAPTQEIHSARAQKVAKK